MNRSDFAGKVKSGLVVLALTIACRESTAPIADVPYLLAITMFSERFLLVNSAGVIERELSCGIRCTYQIANWSVDGTKVALEGTYFENGFTYSALYTADADGSSPVRIATAPSFCTGTHGSCDQTHYRRFYPDWSADGRIVYVENNSVTISNADGSSRRTVFTSTEGVADTRWGTADEIISFRRSGGNLHSVRSIDGSDFRSLTALWVSGYAWSPDRREIALQALRRGDSNPPLFGSIFLLSPLTGDTTELVHNPGIGFSWSPRGNEIAYLNPLGTALFVVDMDGEASLVAEGSFNLPLWSPDGRQIIVRSSSFPHPVVSVNRESGTRREIFGGGDLAWFSVKNSTSHTTPSALLYPD